MVVYLNIMSKIIIFCLLIYFTSPVIGKRKAQGKVKYELNWLGSFAACEDFDNKDVDATPLKVVKDSPTSTILSGELVFMEPLRPDTELLLVIEKETAQGKIMAYTLEVNDLCDHVNESGMPWTVFFDAMNLEVRSCPIPAKSYKFSELKMIMGALDSALNHETVGEYIARVEFRRKGAGLDVVEHDVACHTIGFTVDEVREKSE